MDLSVVEAPEEGLARMLSLGSIVSTTSSSAERETMASDLPVLFRETGTGSIKRVSEHPGTLFVYKVPIIDDHTEEIPRVFWFANADTDEFWDEHLEQFAETSEFLRKRSQVLCIERVLPLPTKMYTR
ncbi:glutathione S-transferase [Apiospora arundinis]